MPVRMAALIVEMSLSPTRSAHQCPYSAHTVPIQCPLIKHTVPNDSRDQKIGMGNMDFFERANRWALCVFPMGTVWALYGHCMGTDGHCVRAAPQAERASRTHCTTVGYISYTNKAVCAYIIWRCAHILSGVGFCNRLPFKQWYRDSRCMGTDGGCVRAAPQAQRGAFQSPLRRALCDRRGTIKSE